MYLPSSHLDGAGARQIQAVEEFRRIASGTISIFPSGRGVEHAALPAHEGGLDTSRRRMHRRHSTPRQ